MKRALARFLAVCLSLGSQVALADANARAETNPPLPSGPVAGYDTAIWVHPGDRSRSMIFGTDQMNTNGLRSYGLDGGQIDAYNTGSARGVDVRYAVPLSTGSIDVLLLAGAGGAIAVYAIGADQSLTLKGTGTMPFVPTALAGWVDPTTRRLYALVGEATAIHKLQFVESPSVPGTFVATDLGSIAIANSTDGIASDEGANRLYYTLRNGTLGQATFSPFQIEPPIDTAGPTAGVTLYPLTDGGTFLLAAGATSRIAVYQRSAAWSFLGVLGLNRPGGTAAISGTIGLDVVGAVFPEFDAGLLVAHDGLNPAGPNFKLYAWQEVSGDAGTLTLPIVETEVGRWVDRNPPMPDAGVGDGGSSDGGATDGGLSDGGSGDGGIDAGSGGSYHPPGGGGAIDDPGKTCGCGASAAGPLLFALLLWLRRVFPR